MNFNIFLNTITNQSFSLPLVILYVTAGCNLRCIMCSYRNPLPGELSLDEVKSLSESLLQFGLRHIVYSGGEPLIRRDLPEICRFFQRPRVKQSLLTNGLLLEKRYDEMASYFHEIIVSLDGPTAEIHNGIRGIESFDQIVEGIQKVLRSPRRPKISLRAVLQRKNFRHLDEMAGFAKSVGVDRISFLAADVYSQAFHRDVAGKSLNFDDVALSRQEAVEFREIVNRFVGRHQADIKSGFISENDKKLHHIVQYFEALAGVSSFPRNHCNAPMVSAVITSTGDLLPCFFLPAFGTIRSGTLGETLNSPAIRATRARVREYSLERCQKCVCTLSVSPMSAFLGQF